MKINYPPELKRRYENFDSFISPPDEYYAIRGCVERINEVFFGDRNEFGDLKYKESIEDRYYPRFKWFQDFVKPQRILNYGCGYREAFALLWYFRGQYALGITNDKMAIEINQNNRTYLSALHETHYPNLLQSDILPEGYISKLTNWYQNNVPKNVPAFLLSDLTKMDNTQPNTYDLVYGRYVLHLIQDVTPSDIPIVIKYLADLVIPSNGRLVIIEPTNNDKYNFTPVFLDAKLKLLTKEVTAIVTLGGEDIEGSNPKGCLFYKP